MGPGHHDILACGTSLRKGREALRVWQDRAIQVAGGGKALPDWIVAEPGFRGGNRRRTPSIAERLSRRRWASWSLFYEALPFITQGAIWGYPIFVRTVGVSSSGEKVLAANDYPPSFESQETTWLNHDSLGTRRSISAAYRKA